MQREILADILADSHPIDDETGYETGQYLPATLDWYGNHPDVCRYVR